MNTEKIKTQYSQTWPNPLRLSIGQVWELPHCEVKLKILSISFGLARCSRININLMRRDRIAYSDDYMTLSFNDFEDAKRHS